MPDRVKERLDRDWHEFLDQANATYEDAYRDIVGLIGGTDHVRRITLEAVVWPEEQQIRVSLGAYLEPEWRRGGEK